MATKTKKRKFLSLEEKAKIIAEAEGGRKKANIAHDFGISPSSLSTVLKNKDSIHKALASGTCSQHKKVTLPKHDELDKAVYTWFVDARARNIPLSGATVQQKALQYACLLGLDDFKASTGWLSRFKTRHGIVGKVLSGESAAADEEAASEWISDNAASLLEQYSPSDIYNADETGLFYEMLPSTTLDFRGQRCHGGKHSKKRVTVLLCANMDGSDKRPPLVIGKSAKPRCFKGNRGLPVKYVANKKAWITRSIFTEWVVAFDCDMKRQGRKVCLLLDNCSAHRIDDVVLTNTEVKYFPPNCTSLIQPLDQGVIVSLKRAYRSRLMQRLLLNIETGRETKIDLYMALQMMAAAWSTLKRETIFNCFKHCGFGNNQAATSSTEAEDEPASEQAEDALIASQWMDLEDKGFVAADLQLDDFVNVDANVEVYEELTDAETVESVQKRGDVSSSGEDDPQDTPTPATASKVMDAFDIIRKVIGAHDDDIAMALLTDCEARVMPLLAVKRKQARLTDFWK